MLLNQGYVPCNKQIHIKIPENELQIYIGNMPVTLVYSYEKFGDRLKDYYRQCYHNPGSVIKSEKSMCQKAS